MELVKHNSAKLNGDVPVKLTQMTNGLQSVRTD